MIYWNSLLGTDRLRFGLQVRVMAVEPIYAAMGFEIRLIKNVPDTRTTLGLDKGSVQDDGRMTAILHIRQTQR
jgi:hypothetical protein